ncbi:hypothetical protein NST62_02095 [Ureibacillus sp. FSL K6-8385]|uniref:Uncharacterized protein n=1 Tax=Ureibacillus terrenus TaxID=118246 RepID=A0A540UW05_9BACL|nr:hypothetical protein [Ureibacillus terrenus]MED3660540.1 hypothetical protein [Ureibacillus terrenus]MED3764947.1 hypothetical protein [Ureibacillus terrenus]TQE88674.1 hypothetical protein FKZ59_13410 [Ureibacillus terrenus]
MEKNILKIKTELSATLVGVMSDCSVLFLKKFAYMEINLFEWLDSLMSGDSMASKILAAANPID